MKAKWDVFLDGLKDHADDDYPVMESQELMEEALDEVDRLKQEVSDRDELLTAAQAEIERLRIELQAALETIVSCGGLSGGLVVARPELVGREQR